MPFLFSPYGHGWHLDRHRFEKELIARAVAAGATRRTNTRVTSVTRDNRNWRLQLYDGSTIDCAFLIDDTGRASWLARRLGARRVVHDRLIATVAFLDGGHCDATTLIEAAEDGWWYSAPLPDSRLVVMLVSDKPHPFTPSPLTQSRIDEGSYAMTAQPRRVDAGSARLDRAGGDGWLAIGDAAMSFDPISSHGLLTALSTGLAAGETSLPDYQAFVDTTWRAYARMRQACYASEGRWAGAHFWRRRRGAGYHLSD
jgi:flavin-dependent dehydrogenase